MRSELLMNDDDDDAADEPAAAVVSGPSLKFAGQAARYADDR